MKDALRLNSSPTTSHNAGFPTSMSGGVELGAGETFNPTPALPATSRFWFTKRGRATVRELSDADSSKVVLNTVSPNKSIESGRVHSEAESDVEMGARRVKQGGGTIFE